MKRSREKPVIYAILIFGAEGVFDRLPEDEQEEVLEKHRQLQRVMGEKNALGAVAKLMKPEAAVSMRQSNGPVIVTDGPFAESKEQLLGLYLVDCATMEEAIDAAKMLPIETASYEIRPVEWSNWTPGDDAPAGV
jgi:hypothetical protein